MARSNPAPAASRRELETIALIGSRRDLLWQLADEARGYENFATVVADQGLHDEPFDVQVDAFISFVNERVTHGDAAPDWTALEDTYGERADTIIEGARSATPVAMEVVLYFPAGDGPDGQETLAVGGVTVAGTEQDRGGMNEVYLEDVETGEAKWFEGRNLHITGASIQGTQQ